MLLEEEEVEAVEEEEDFNPVMNLLIYCEIIIN